MSPKVVSIPTNKDLFPLKKSESTIKEASVSHNNATSILQFAEPGSNKGTTNSNLTS